MTAQSATNKVFIHISNRSAGSNDLFRDKKDYEVFKSYLADCLTPPDDPQNLKSTFSIKDKTYTGIPRQPNNYHEQIDLIAYCLTKDHFHLVIEECESGFSEKLMRSLSTRYAIYYNKKYKNTGSVFQRPYKSLVVESITALILLTKYIHEEAKDNDGVSSYEEYLGESQNVISDPKPVMTYFESSKEKIFKEINGYKDFVEKYNLTDQDYAILGGVSLEEISQMETTKENKENKEPIGVYAPNNYTDKDKRSSFGFLMASLAAFAILFVLGINNIQQTKASNADPILAVESENGSGAEKNNPEVEQSASSVVISPEVAGVATENTELEAQTPKQKIKILIKDGSKSVNLREKPSIYSEKIGEATDGEEFEYVSSKAGWYEIVLDEGQTGFVSGKYTEKIFEEDQTDKGFINKQAP